MSGTTIRAVVALLVPLLLVACGSEASDPEYASASSSTSSSSSGATSAQTYTISGSITGLTAAGLVLLQNGSNAMHVAINAKQFTMGTKVAYGQGYAITVQSQPAGETCIINQGAGSSVIANVTNVAITCAPWHDFTASILYSFAGDSDGANPWASLLQGGDGSLYGTTYEGGANGTGTVFRVTTAGVESVVYAFGPLPSVDTSNVIDGNSPEGGLLLGSDGNFYGTTTAGGIGEGTVFKLSPMGVESVIYHFVSDSVAGEFDGGVPRAGLLLGSDGNFYGTTEGAGSGRAGTIFKVTPGGLETVLHAFAGGNDGANPEAALIQDSNGNLYGTTSNGGLTNNGTVFKITLTGDETVVYSFAGGSDGSTPLAGLIQGSDGNFYGTTWRGGSNSAGTVYRITPDGVESVLYSFAGGTADGSAPRGALIVGEDGQFYGTTEAGGLNDDGTIFRISPDGTESVLHSFLGGSDGQDPASGLIEASDGAFYGTTKYGGMNNNGTVFKLTPQ